MGTYHYHVIRCPHCGNEDGNLGCYLDKCGFARTSIDLTEYPETEICRHCGEAYSLDDGRWSGDVPPWEREELIDEASAKLIEIAIDLAHKRVGFGEFKTAARAYESNMRKYRLYKMASGGGTITDWPSLFESPEAAAAWASEKELTDGLNLHEYLVVKDETKDEIVKYL